MDHHSKILTLSGLLIGLLFILAVSVVPSRSLDPGLQLGQAVGARVGVPANEFNTLAEALADKEKELLMREDILRLKEDANTSTLFGVSNPSASQNDTLMIIMTALLSILVLLVILNFYYDHKRIKDLEEALTNL